MHIVMSIKTCAVILNWNGWQDTLACLDSLIVGSRIPELIVVVDNDSTDDSCEKILQWAGEQQTLTVLADSDLEKSSSLDVGLQPAFLLLRNFANQGYACGNNLALRYVMERCPYTYFWVLNNDTLVEEGSLNALVTYAQSHGEIGIIGSTIACSQQMTRVECGGGATYSPATTVFRNVLEGYSVDAAIHYSGPLQLDYVVGCSMFIRKEVFRDCGLFAEEFFLFYEELDLCNRAKGKGYKLGWCRQSFVFHKGGGTIGRMAVSDRKRLSFVNYHENLSTLIYSKKWHVLFLPWILSFRFLGKCFYLIKRGDFFLFRSLLDGFVDFFRGRNQREHYGKRKSRI